MRKVQDRLIRSSRWAVRIAIWSNRLFLATVVLGLLASWLLHSQFAALFIQGSSHNAEITGLRWLLALGVAMSAATEVLLTSLKQIVESAAAGDPFVASNARRLKRMGWALLGLQLLDIPGSTLHSFFPSLGNAAPDIAFSPGGWIAVLMMFVLSHVFTAGSAMKTDLEGTV